MTCPGFLFSWFGTFFSRWIVFLRTKFNSPPETNNNNEGYRDSETFYFSADVSNCKTKRTGDLKRHLSSQKKFQDGQNCITYKGYKYRSTALRNRKRVRISGGFVHAVGKTYFIQCCVQQNKWL